MDYSILINKENKIKNNYIEKVNLVKTIDVYGKECFIEEQTYEKYLELQKFLKEKNIEIGIESAYRDIEYQKEVYQEYLEKYGKEYADKYVAPPEYSEHHTGLAIDISLKINGEYPDYNKEPEERIKTYEEIHPYLKDFGFILRYPKGKEDKTGYPYEPWHIRYVGKFIAKVVEESDITFDEYKNKYSGVIVINKKKDCTSFDIVNKISKLFGIKRVGHTGTLDPLAEGVLVVCIGQATKIVELLTAEDKEYVAGVKLGLKTDSYDIEGKIIEENTIPNSINIKEVLTSYKKTKEIDLLNEEKDTFTFKTLVTKGCYIRSLINDIGNDIGCGAIMTSLIRTKQGPISIEKAYTLEDIEQGNYKIYKVEEVLDYPQIIVDKDLELKIHNGMKIFNNWKIKDKVIFKNQDNKLLGIYEVDNQKLKVWKNFN